MEASFQSYICKSDVFTGSHRIAGVSLVDPAHGHVGIRGVARTTLVMMYWYGGAELSAVVGVTQWQTCLTIVLKLLLPAVERVPLLVT